MGPLECTFPLYLLSIVVSWFFKPGQVPQRTLGIWGSMDQQPPRIWQFLFQVSLRLCRNSYLTFICSFKRRKFLHEIVTHFTTKNDGITRKLCYNFSLNGRELLSGEKEGLLQLPSDKALLEDPVFRPLVEKYAAVCRLHSDCSFKIIFTIFWHRHSWSLYICYITLVR